MEFTHLTVDGHLSDSKYASSIKEIIKKLPDTSNGRLHFTRTNDPILPLQNDANPGFFEVGLRASPTGLTLRFRRDNLYLVGFRIDHGQTYTFNANYLPGTPMGFGPEYDNMIGAAKYNVPEAGSKQGQPGHNTGLMRVNLGRKALIDAVAWATNTSGDEQAQKVRRAKAALAFCLMFAEALRFVPVLEYVKMVWVQHKDEHPNLAPQWMDVLVKRWRELSLLVLRYDANVNRDPKETNQYKWVPPQLRIDKFVVEKIDKSVTKRRPKPVEGSENTITFEALTAVELLLYLGVLLRGSVTMDDLKDNPR